MKKEELGAIKESALRERLISIRLTGAESKGNEFRWLDENIIAITGIVAAFVGWRIGFSLLSCAFNVLVGEQSSLCSPTFEQLASEVRPLVSFSRRNIWKRATPAKMEQEGNKLNVTKCMIIFVSRFPWAPPFSIS